MHACIHAYLILIAFILFKRDRPFDYWDNMEISQAKGQIMLLYIMLYRLQVLQAIQAHSGTSSTTKDEDTVEGKTDFYICEHCVHCEDRGIPLCT